MSDRKLFVIAGNPKQAWNWSQEHREIGGEYTCVNDMHSLVGVYEADYVLVGEYWRNPVYNHPDFAAKVARLNRRHDLESEPGGETAKACCYECGRSYGDEYGFPDLIVPDWAWPEISPTGDAGGLLCPTCLCESAYNAGIECEAYFTSGPFANRTVTFESSWKRHGNSS